MEISKEILLLNDVLNYKPYSEEILIQLIQDICQGLDVPLSQEEKKFLQTKISYGLFCFAAKQDNEFKILYQTRVKSSAHLPWHSLFHICIKTNIISSFFELLFENLPKQTLHVFIEKYCQEIVKLDCNEIVSSLCSLSSKLLQSPNHIITTVLSKFVEYLIQRYEALSFCPVAEYHVRVLEQAIQPLENANKKRRENVKELDLAVLKRLQKLSVCDISDKTVVQCVIESFQKPVFDKPEINCRSGFTDRSECSKDFALKLNSLIGKHFNRLIQIADRSSWVEDYCHSLKLFESELNVSFELTSNSTPQVNSKNLPSWELDSALFCATNLLQNYDEAVEYVLARLSDDGLAQRKVNECLKMLSDVPECMMLTKHMICLCKVIKQLWQNAKNLSANDNFSCAIELLAKVYVLLPLSSKLALVNRRCDEKHAENTLHHRILQLHSNNTDNLQRKINLVFNKMTKADVEVDFDNFLHSVCNVAFVAPQLTLKKIVDHIASHEENHDLLLKLFEAIPCLPKIESDQHENMLLMCFIQSVEERAAKDNAIQSICCFISLLLNADSLKNIFCHYFTTQILRVYVLPVLSERQNLSINKQNLSVEFSLNLIKCVFHIFADIEAFDLFVLAYQLAYLIDNFVVSDGLTSLAKATLIELVEVLVPRVKNENLNSDWLRNVAKSLSWSTQLYLRSVLSSCKNYITYLPESLKQVCTLPEAETLHFDASYGEGTGLTAWLQCLIVDPTFLPLESLNVQDLSQEEQKFFKHGLVIALSQILPFCLEEDWKVILEVLKAMLNEHLLHVAYPIDRLRALPFVNLKNFRNSLCILELLHQVTIVLHSPCCSSWMLSAMWSRYARCTAIALKQMLRWDFLPEDVLEKVEQQAFFLCQLFFHCCDFLIILESLRDCDGAADSIFVLLLDIVTQFCTIYECSKDLNNSVLSEITSLHSLVLSCIENITNDEMQQTLVKKLVSQI